MACVLDIPELSSRARRIYQAAGDRHDYVIPEPHVVPTVVFPLQGTLVFSVPREPRALDMDRGRMGRLTRVKL
jgi:hypothetical protein